MRAMHDHHRIVKILEGTIPNAKERERKMKTTISYLYLSVGSLLFLLQPCLSFAPKNVVRHKKLNSLHATNDDASAELITPTSPVASEDAVRLKEELLALAESTQRGFKASREEKQNAKSIVAKLAKLNPTAEPAKSYYDDADKSSNDEDIDSASPDLSGKWTLIYTDAPDITSLDTSNNPLATSKLGRIGQECSPPYIRMSSNGNVPTLPIRCHSSYPLVDRMTIECCRRW